MPLDGQCPDCGGFLKPNAKKCTCGWSVKPLGKTSGAAPDLNRFRCEWTSGADRCCYPGTSSADTHGGGPWYCGGHFGCSDPVIGSAIIQASRAVQLADYTAGTMLAATRQAFLARPIYGSPGPKIVPSSKNFKLAGHVASLHAPRQREPGEEG